MTSNTPSFHYAFGIALCATLSACSGSAELEDDSNLDTLQGELRNGSVPDEWGQGVVAIIATFPGLGVQRCTGTFVNRFDILTAAHCVETADGAKASKVEVVFGKDWNGARTRAQRFAPHPDWTPQSTVENDIAVVSFDEPTAPSGTAFALPNFAMPDGTFEGRRVVIAGFGKTNDAQSSAGKKRWAYARVDENRSHELIVDGDDGAAVCDGDSGGPIALYTGGRWVLVGVLNAGGAGCTDGLGYAAMPTNQADFINDHLTIGGIVIP